MNGDKKGETEVIAAASRIAGVASQDQVSNMILIPDPLSPNTLERCRKKTEEKRTSEKRTTAIDNGSQRGLRRSTRARKIRQCLEFVHDTDEEDETMEESAKEGEEDFEDTSQSVALRQEKLDHDQRNSLSIVDFYHMDETLGHHDAQDGARFKLGKKPTSGETATEEAFIVPPPTLMERHSTMDRLIRDATPLALSPGISDWFQQGISQSKDDLADDLELERDRARLVMEKCSALVAQWPPLATQINEASIRTKDGRFITPPLLPPSNHNSTAIEPNVCNSSDEASITTKCKPNRKCRTKMDRMLSPDAYPQKVRKLRRLGASSIKKATDYITLPKTPLQSLAASKHEDASTPKTNN